MWMAAPRLGFCEGIDDDLPDQQARGIKMSLSEEAGELSRRFESGRISEKEMTAGLVRLAWNEEAGPFSLRITSAKGYCEMFYSDRRANKHEGGRDEVKRRLLEDLLVIEFHSRKV